MDKDTHVYCTDCIFYAALFNGLMFSTSEDIPEECKSCYPFDTEDSRSFELRKNYREAVQFTEIKYFK
jgi:hypothetical protein